MKSLRQKQAVPEDKEPFPYGWRFVRQARPDGSFEVVQVPLTLLDVLHPKEDDFIPEKPSHESDRRYLSDVLHERTDGKGLVLSDCIIDWNVAGLGNHSPDIAYFPGVLRRLGDWGIYQVAWDNMLAALVIEITSIKTRDNDLVIKVDHYHRAGVQFYVIVDRETANGNAVIGYRRTPRKYVRLPLDEHGRLYLEPVDLLLGFDRGRVLLYEPATGKELGDYQKTVQELKAETVARRKAERALRKEKVKRMEAEQQMRKRIEAEQQLQKRIQELEEELRRMRDG